MKKIILFSIIASFYFGLNVLAHPGNTASDGCHYCWTNCSSWGYTYGTRHCHGGSSYSSPSYTPSIPTCPLHSSYDYLDKKCECNSGYVTNSSGSGCISMDQWCDDKYGWNSKYNSLNDNCECNSGYVFGKNIFGDIQCIDGDSWCSDQYGIHSSYDSYGKKCKCDSGYYLSGSKCVEEEDDSSYSGINSEALYHYLQSSAANCGINSHKTIEGKCSCDSGYMWEDYEDEANLDCIKRTCSDGYILLGNECISHTKNCENSYGKNIVGVKGDNGNSSCYCALGYEWNTGKTSCIKEQVNVLGISNETEYKIKKFIEDEKNKTVAIDNALANRLSGKILLQVEGNGEAWYVNPKNKNRYYMANGTEAYNIMRELGVGITNSDLANIKINNSEAKKHKGKIFLQVQASGEAYYVDYDGNLHYLKDGAAAYTIMRELGLGIKNSDLRNIVVGEVE